MAKRDLPGHKSLKKRDESANRKPAGLGHIVEDASVETDDRNNSDVFAREVVDIGPDETVSTPMRVFLAPVSDGLLRWLEDAVFPDGVAPGRSAADMSSGVAIHESVNDPLFTPELHAFIDKYVL